MYSFPNLEPVCCSMSSSNCCFLTNIQISQIFLLHIKWSGIPISWRIFYSLLWFIQLSELQWKEGRKKGGRSSCSIMVKIKFPQAWIETNTQKLFKKWEYQTALPGSWEICMQVKKQQLEPDMENGLVPNWERSVSSLYIVTLLICRVHHAKCQAGWSTS